MLKKTNLTILVLSFLIFSEALANDQLEEEHIPINDIFVNHAVEVPDEKETESGEKAQSIALAGLLLSVFIVIGTGRAYGILHGRINMELAGVQSQRSAIICDSVRIYDSEVVETLVECDNLEQEIAEIEHQLNQIQQEI